MIRSDAIAKILFDIFRESLTDVGIELAVARWQTVIELTRLDSDQKTMSRKEKNVS